MAPKEGDDGFLGWRNWKYPITFFHKRETTESDFKGELKDYGIQDFTIGQMHNPLVHPNTSIAYNLKYRYPDSKMRTLFTDVFAPNSTAQHTHCKDFELNAMECLEYFGMKQGLDACKDYYDDFMECQLRTKQLMRVSHMRRKRHRDNYIEYLQGKRTKESLYEDPPKMHAFIEPWVKEENQYTWRPNC